MKKGCLRRFGKALALLYAGACVLVFLLPIGGCATQSVLNMTDGRLRGMEAFLPPEIVAQQADSSVVMRVVCQTENQPQPVAFETVVATSNLLVLIERAPRRAPDDLPLVDVISCIRMGHSRWLDEVPPNAAARVAACPWVQGHNADAWYISNAVVHTIRLENRLVPVAFRGRSHYYEEWAWWNTPLQKFLLVPATCWDVLTAVVQIPYYVAGDVVHSILSLGGPGNDNPWCELERVRRFPSPRLLNLQERRVSVTPETDDDIQFGDAEWKNMNASCVPEAVDRRHAAIAAYTQYLFQLPDGRHVAEATNKLAQLRTAEDEMLFCRVQDSIAGLTAFAETHPTSAYTASAKAKLAIMVRTVTIRMRPPPDTGDATQRARGRSLTFVVGVTTRAAVEASLGAGTAVEQPPATGAKGYRWEVAYHRDQYIPDHLDYPGKELPVRSLVLLFNANDTLVEIQGD